VDRENSQKSITRRELSCSRGKGGRRVKEVKERKEGREGTLHKSCTSIKGCLKRDID
jgi:hypothetical protein